MTFIPSSQNCLTIMYTIYTKEFLEIQQEYTFYKDCATMTPKILRRGYTTIYWLMLFRLVRLCGNSFEEFKCCKAGFHPFRLLCCVYLHTYRFTQQGKWNNEQWVMIMWKAVASNNYWDCSLWYLVYCTQIYEKKNLTSCHGQI